MAKDVSAVEVVAEPSAVKPVSYTIYVDCSVCNGAGKVSSIDGEGKPIEIDCPTCKGKGQLKFGIMVQD